MGLKLPTAKQMPYQKFIATKTFLALIVNFEL